MKTLIEVIAQMKDEITQDVLNLIVPVDVESFGELHDYVDANCYGGFCDDDGITDELIAHFGGRDADEGMPQGVIDFMNKAQNSVNTWITNGKLADRVNGYDWEDYFTPQSTADLIRTIKAMRRALVQS